MGTRLPPVGLRIAKSLASHQNGWRPTRMPLCYSAWNNGTFSLGRRIATHRIQGRRQLALAAGRWDYRQNEWPGLAQFPAPFQLPPQLRVRQDAKWHVTQNRFQCDLHLQKVTTAGRDARFWLCPHPHPADKGHGALAGLIFTRNFHMTEEVPVEG